MNFESGAILLIDKPISWTSFDVVNKLRYAIKKRYNKKIKVGHAGTLDPLATGLLILCTGKMTRQIDEYTGMPKEYTGSFYLGATTPSYDLELPQDATFPTAHITEAMMQSVVKKFTGIQQQMPPVFSALKVDGTAAYKSARQGKIVELKAREINIYEFELTRIEMPVVDFRVVCSKGTYIRSLAHDFGKALESGAYLQSLRRTKIGDFKIEEALGIESSLTMIEQAEIDPPL